jgi:ATP-dependent RNA helicase DDX41
MPRKIQEFAQQSLTKPVLVNVGRAGAANLDVLQVVEYVKQEAKMVYLLECLQKTPPPVIIFSENKNEVDGMLPDGNVYVPLIILRRYPRVSPPQRC